MIHIDGSYGEGGGQMVRTCLTLSAITGKSFALKPIRPKRPKSGLLPQHLMACLAINKICRGRLEGAALGSHSLAFEPGKIKGGEYQFDIGTAGSLILLAQTLIPVCLYADQKCKILITGGTHVTKSPNYDYFEHIFLPAIARFGVNIKSRLNKVGYYPKGGGMIELEIAPQKMHGCMNWKTAQDQFSIIRLSRLPHHILERERRVLMHHGINNIIVHEDNDSLSTGSAMTLCNGFKGACVLGEIGKRAEQVAEEAVSMLNQEMTGNIDHYLADQLLIYAALANGNTRYETSKITQHLHTNLFIIHKFLERKILIEGNEIIVQ